jgi:hypothetical protein
MHKIIKIILAILFFLCLLKMPYGYYQIVRFIGLVGFALLAYHASDRKKKNEMIIYACLAMLFQPFLKFSLGREIWNAIDVIVGVGLIINIIYTSKQSS